MANNSETTALERLMRPLSRLMSIELARALVKIEADDETQARFDELSEKCTEGHLTSQEQVELESLVRANRLLGILKAEAQLLLSHSKEP